MRRSRGDWTWRPTVLGSRASIWLPIRQLHAFRGGRWGGGSRAQGGPKKEAVLIEGSSLPTQLDLCWQTVPGPLVLAPFQDLLPLLLHLILARGDEAKRRFGSGLAVPLPLHGDQ